MWMSAKTAAPALTDVSIHTDHTDVCALLATIQMLQMLTTVLTLMSVWRGGVPVWKEPPVLILRVLSNASAIQDIDSLMMASSVKI
jgi:hypothetical protein